MAFSKIGVATASAALLVHSVSAEPWSLCKGNQCGDCPVSITDEGTGYPDCVIYSSDDVFGGSDFPKNPQGEYNVYLDIPEPDPDCKVIVKTPASTSEPGCGAIIGSFSRAGCEKVSLDETFMVQFCCGIDDCREAGAKRSAKFSPNYARGLLGRSSSPAAYLKDAEGNIIQPVEVGTPVDAPAKRWNPLAARQAPSCKKDSWVADEGKEDYTRPADRAQIMATEQEGPGEIAISNARTQSYTTSFETSVGFDGIASMTVGFEMTEEVTDTTIHTFILEEGELGDVAFTPYLRCSTGRGQCDGEEVVGEVCTPFTTYETNILEGKWTLVASS